MLDLLGGALSARFYRHPVFQVGASRSGTIVLYQALGRHPAIFSMPSENPFVTYVAAGVMPFTEGAETDYFARSVRLRQEELFRSLARLCFETSAGPHKGARVLAKGLLAAPLEWWRKRRWCVKCFPNAAHARALMRLYPGCKFVYIVRSGIDVVRSRSEFPAFSEQPFEAHCDFWLQATQKFRYLQAMPEAVTLRQEALLEDPDGLFRTVFAHLGLEYSPRPTEYVTSTLVHSRADESTRRDVDIRRHFRERPPAYEDWEPWQRDVFKQVCGGAMEELGYSVPF